MRDHAVKLKRSELLAILERIAGLSTEAPAEASITALAKEQGLPVGEGGQDFRGAVWQAVQQIKQDILSIAVLVAYERAWEEYEEAVRMGRFGILID